MTWKSTTALVGIVGMATVIAAAAAHAQNDATKLLTGDAKVEVVASYQGDPLPKPDKILICDFTVSPDVVTVDQSAAARLQRRRLQRREPDADSSPEALAGQVQNAFAKALVSELQKTAVPAETAPADNAAIPAHTLIVHGEFTTINQGNKTKRMMIGFGRGASDVQAHVTVSLTTDAQPVVLSEFNLTVEERQEARSRCNDGCGFSRGGRSCGRRRRQEGQCGSGRLPDGKSSGEANHGSDDFTEVGRGPTRSPVSSRL